MSETWLISDPHFGHALAAKERGFDSVEGHDAWLVRQCQVKVGLKDDLFWLGDMAFAGWKDRLHNIMPKLPGRHHLVLGNHDRAHPLNSRAFDHQHQYVVWFDSMQTSAQLSWEGRKLLLSHFPYQGEGERKMADRHTQWRLRDEGTWLIHGHTHSTKKFSLSLKGTLQLHAGVDAWRGPVRLGELVRAGEAWLAELAGKPDWNKHPLTGPKAQTAAEGDPGTWSHCGNRSPHSAHIHTFAMNEGPYTVQCNGTPWMSLWTDKAVEL